MRFVVVAAVAGCAPNSLAGRVVIIEGNDPDPGLALYIHERASEAEANYVAKGYTVLRLPNTPAPVTKAAAIQAINNPINNAFCYVGHGRDNGAGLWLNIGAGADGLLFPSDLGAGSCPQFKHVELQACAQERPGWHMVFSNPAATFQAYTTPVPFGLIRNSIKNESPTKIPQKTARGNAPDEPAFGVPPDSVDARFVARILAAPSHVAFPDVDELFDKWIELGFTLPPPLGAVFGSRSFNVQVSGPIALIPLHGLTLDAGVITGEHASAFPIPVASFTLSMDSTTFRTAMANLDSIASLRAAGMFTVTGNLTPLPANVLLDAALGAYFGTYSLAPPCPGDTNGDGHTTTVDLTILLGNFGSAATLGASGDLNYDGVVNTVDLTILLGAFGC